jgi:chromosome partitioning protein
MLTIAVLNQKGGVGKSTLSTNLAAVAHLKGKRTLVLDLDTQGSSFDWFSARKDGSQLDGLNVARADKDLSLPKFKALSQGYDVVVCDGPPRLGNITVAAAVAADVVVIPLRAGGFDWWAAAETLEKLDQADELRVQLGRKKVRRLFVLNGAVANANLTADAMEKIADVGELSDVIVHNRVAFGEAVSEGESVMTKHAGSPAAEEIRDLYESITGGKKNGR